MATKSPNSARVSRPELWSSLPRQMTQRRPSLRQRRSRRPLPPSLRVPQLRCLVPTKLPKLDEVDLGAHRHRVLLALPPPVPLAARGLLRPRPNMIPARVPPPVTAGGEHRVRGPPVSPTAPAQWRRLRHPLIMAPPQQILRALAQRRSWARGPPARPSPPAPSGMPRPLPRGARQRQKARRHPCLAPESYPRPLGRRSRRAYLPPLIWIGAGQ